MDYNEIITAATTFSGLNCPSCASHSFRKHGKCLGIQRYRCKNCGRCFKETVNTPLHWIHNKPNMMRYSETMRDRLTIRGAAEKLGISINTSFCWRHKILSSFRTYNTQPTGSPAGACQINMPHSFKGKRNIQDKKMPTSRTILVADHRGIPCLQLMPSKCSATKAAKLLTEHLSPEAIIANKPAHLLTRAIQVAGNATIQNNSLKNRLVAQVTMRKAEIELWMERFHGVATKYLQQYWNWYRTETGISSSTAGFTTECFAHRQLLHYRVILKE